MSQQVLNSRLISLSAGADLSGSIKRLLKLDGNGDAVVATGNSRVVGVLQNKPESGQAASVAIGDTAKVVAGGTVAIGGEVESDANGAAVAVSGAGEHEIVGIALEAGVTNDVIEVLLKSYVRDIP